MNVPSGYTALDMVGFSDKGLYNSATAYVKNDIAHYGGNLWRCLVDDTTNVTPTEGANWTVFLAEPTSAAEDIIAPVEASAVSTRQYAVGKQLILNDTLYRVTAAVNIGDTLVVDTNIALSDTVVEQLATKANTSSLATVATSGSYADLSNKPTLGTAAAKDVPASGNASTTEVVMGDDTRLSDARNAADVYSWAKASTKPTYNGSEINTSAAQTGTAQSAVAATIASGTSMDAAVKDLLDNDVTLSSQISSVNEALTKTQNFYGSKNILTFSKLASSNPFSQNGITYTFHEDTGIVNIVSNGASTGATSPYCYLPTFDENTDVIISIEGADSAKNDYLVYDYTASATLIYGSTEQSVTIPANHTVGITIRSFNGKVYNETIKLMIRVSGDNTFVPYAMTNKELTQARFLNGTVGTATSNTYTDSAEYTIPSDGWYSLANQINVANTANTLLIELGSKNNANSIAAHRTSGTQYESANTVLPLKSGTKVIFACTDTSATCGYTVKKVD